MTDDSPTYEELLLRQAQEELRVWTDEILRSLVALTNEPERPNRATRRRMARENKRRR